MSDTPPPETSRAPEPPYAKAPRHRVLPDFIASKLKRELEEGEAETSQSSEGGSNISTSQSSEESTQPITKEVLLELKEKLDGYVEREDPSTAKNGPKYDHLDVTPTSSQASGSQVNYGSQESANGLANLEELIPYFTETLGWEGICKACRGVKPGPFKSDNEKFKAMDELHTRLNENVLAILKLVDACLDTFKEPCNAEAAEEYSPRKRTRSAGTQPNWTAPPPSP
jgi:hypothetical protein